MKDDRDPPLLRRASDSPASLVEALELARGEVPSAAQVDRLGASLDALTASGESQPGSEEVRRRRSIRPVAAGATASFKLLLAAAVAASGLGVGYWHFARAPNERATREAAGSPAATVEARPVTPFDAEQVPHREGPAVPTRDPGPATAIGPESLPKTLTGAKVEAHRAAGTTDPVGAAAFADPATTEVALLGRAQQSLAPDPGAALALTQEHARAFPSGTLAQEREFISIQALEALGRRTDAVARAARFRAQYPSSAHLRRLDLLLATPTDAVPQ